MANDRDETCSHEGCRCRLDGASHAGGYCSAGCAVGEGCSHAGCTCGIASVQRPAAPAVETRD
jgi:hypothetical protein